MKIKEQYNLNDNKTQEIYKNILKTKSKNISESLGTSYSLDFSPDGKYVASGSNDK